MASRNPRTIRICRCGTSDGHNEHRFDGGSITAGPNPLVFSIYKFIKTITVAVHIYLVVVKSNSTFCGSWNLVVIGRVVLEFVILFPQYSTSIDIFTMQ